MTIIIISNDYCHVILFNGHRILDAKILIVKLLRILSIILLLFVGASAVYGGLALVIDPTGALLQMPFHYIGNSPFSNYFIPGLILFLFNGLLSLFISLTVYFQFRNYGRYIYMQGFILLGWIVIQIMMLQVTFWLQFVIGSIGLALILFGMVLDLFGKEK